jgi:transcriptional regulator with XRE-family HTH domain
MKNIKPRENSIDLHVGARTRALRIRRGVSQAELASELGLSFQQVQKYETAANRISASKLYTIAKVLRVRPSYFFEGLDSDDSEIIELDQEAAHFAALISKVPNKNTRACLRELIKQITSQETLSPEGQAPTSTN